MPEQQNPADPSSSRATRLTRPDLGRLALLVLLGAAFFALGLHLFPSAFPEATIDFRYDRNGSRGIAESFLQEQGAAIQGYRYAGAFQYDDSAKVFLERELGLAEMQDAVAGTARVWMWSHRWFRPLQKEEFRVDVAPTGEIVRYTHLLPDTAAGGAIDEEAARRLAEEQLSLRRADGLAGLRFLGATARTLENRTDRQFTWDREDVDWKGGRYRHQVTIQGDRFGSYQEFVHVPEEWNRAYSGLRSANIAAGTVASVLFVVTFLVMLVVVVQQHRRGAIRWRLAGWLGLIGGVLAMLASLNDLPSDLFAYETTDSFGGFVAERILIGLLQAVAVAIGIIVIVAAGESEYRRAFPGKLSVAGLLSWRGLRTKEFLFSAVGGITLTGFFLAYQSVFYRIASSLGAWSPADVPYTELLNTTFPWAFLLYIGFIPSVTEEFASRAFSVPFFGRLFKSRIVGILLASAIWGFGHSTYPNQPFYIRGLELLLAGSLVSVLMIRANLLALLVWHYTIDAVYSGYLLFRSGDSYYVASAVIAGGIILLPIVISVVAYLRTGRFADPEAMRQRAGPAESSVEPDAAAAPPVARPPEAAIGVPVLSRRRVGIVLAAAAAALAIALVIGSATRGRAPESPLRVSRAEAREKAMGFLRAQGIDPSPYRVIMRVDGWGRADAWRYVQGRDGMDGVARLWPDTLAAGTWRVRLFRPLQADEARVRVDVTSGRIVAYEHRIAEAESLATPEPAAAESTAVALLASAGLRVAGLERREASDDPKPKRVDRSYAWEAPDGDARNVAEARYRLESRVAGDRAAGLSEFLRLPEEYERARAKRTMAWGLALALLLASCGGILALTLNDAFRGDEHGAIPWKRLLRVGVLASLIGPLASTNALPRLLFEYDTSVPWGNFLVVVVVGFVTAMVAYFFVAWSGTALLRGLHPVLSTLGDPSARRRMLPAAVLALFVTPIGFFLLGKVRALMALVWPASAPPLDLEPSVHLEALVPAVSAVTATIVGTFIGGLAIGSLAALLRNRGWPGRPGRLLLLLALWVSIALLPARSAGEFAVQFLSTGLLLGLGWAIMRWICAGNPLAIATGLFAFFAVRALSALLGEPSRWARGHGIVAALVLLVPVVWMLAEKRHPEPGPFVARGSRAS
jgi:membrane protease YdiL (CAAX protease family)